MRIATRKFGAHDATRLADLLDSLDDAARLAKMGEWIIDCETSADFIARVNRAGSGRV